MWVQARNFDWTDPASGSSCRFTGTLVQDRVFGQVDAAYSCGSETGAARFSEMRQNGDTLTARWIAGTDAGGCRTEGYLTGVRRR